MDGIINIIKPVGVTSYSIVNRIKKITGVKKIGHTGTLDPCAAGVLPLCLGNATKIAGYLSDMDKSYRGEITFGITTDTQDLCGNIVTKQDVCILRSQLEGLLPLLEGDIKQIPPMYSAVKHNGKRLYQLARQGIEVERTPRDIKVYSLKLIDFFPPDRAFIDIVCSKGTYIRTLFHDIGERAGCGAVMSFLVRIRSGPFCLQDAVTIEEVEEAERQHTLMDHILPVDYPLSRLRILKVKDVALKYALNGNPLYPHNILLFDGNVEKGEIVRIYSKDRFIAIGEVMQDSKTWFVKIKRLFYK